ncbi:MAG: hypothetical protein JNL58_24930 [Planctomyces sp.]|nr:hypothetical protein [Planctomyces sp.]
MLRSSWFGIILLIVLLCISFSVEVSAQAVPVRVAHVDGQLRLLRGGEPYFIQGAGGNGSRTLLVECGGNSIRTWGIGPETGAELDEAHRLGLTVTLGIWLGHKQHGFRYDDPVMVRQQFEDVKAAVVKYKDHPAVLMWGIGNEMEIDNESDALWQAIGEIAAMVKQVDPNHPTMTVIAEIGKDKVQQIHKHCPEIDVIGVNSYGGGATVATRYRETGATKPFVLTEFGPPGTWETELNSFKAAPELTSTEKSRHYRSAYQGSVSGAKEMCLGSYVFTWGHKIEATSTWFGMLLPDGSRLAAVDTMQELWTGKSPDVKCPEIKSLQITSNDQVGPGDTVSARVTLGAGDSAAIVHWELQREQSNYSTAGTGAPGTSAYPDAIAENSLLEVNVKMPQSGGMYRLYCYVRAGDKRAAVGSLPIFVRGRARLEKAAVASVPLTIYGDQATALLFSPSGYMGNTAAIKMQEDCDDNPHSGKTCLRVQYNDVGNWGGVIWQHPANDWGNSAGGYNLSDAEKLVFWARGARGGEKIKFGVGAIGMEMKYHDSCKAEIEVTLTPQWKEYTIDLSEKELARIKSGFLWSLSGQGESLEFFLDDITYQ